MAVTIDENDETDPGPERTCCRDTFVQHFLHVGSCQASRSSDYSNTGLEGCGCIDRSLPEEPVRLLVDREDHHIGRLQAMECEHVLQSEREVK